MSSLDSLPFARLGGRGGVRLVAYPYIFLFFCFFLFVLFVADFAWDSLCGEYLARGNICGIYFGNLRGGLFADFACGFCFALLRPLLFLRPFFRARGGVGLRILCYSYALFESKIPRRLR